VGLLFVEELHPIQTEAKIDFTESEAAMKKIRGAVIGVGYLGTFHAQKIATNSKSELVAVFDHSPEQSKKVAETLKTNSIQNLEDIAKTVDFVTIAASTMAHYELANFFLSKKIPVLVEKPIAATAELGLQLSELADKNKTIFSVGHIERFNPAYEYLKQNFADTKYLELNRLAPFRVRGSDVSVLHDLMIHDMDLVNFIFKQKIKSHMICGHQLIRQTVDDVSLRLELESGTQITIQNSRLCPQIIRNYRAIQKNCTLFVNTATLEGEFLYSDPSNETLMRTEKIQIPKVDALALEIDHFISAVQGEKVVAITGYQATEALKQIESYVQELNH
jgi:predicted dehydrogenase